MTWKKKTGGDSITSGSANGKMNVNGQELTVFDDTSLKDSISQKANVTHKHNSSDIEDFDTTNKTVGYALQYDSTLGKFVSKALPSGTTSGGQYINDLLDVDTVAIAPKEGDTLVFQGGVWKPGKSASSKANAEIPLYIETPSDGGMQPIHPKVVYFPTRWNGYQYWMAFTPHPNDPAENPCIAKSNDCIRWHSNTNNPLDRPTNYANMSYFSDTHLLYNPDTAKLECWYRGVNTKTSPYQELIYRKTSSDGTNWSAAELMHTEQSAVTDTIRAVCPCIIYDAGKYRIWAGYDRSKIKYYETPDGKNWQFIADVVGTNDWHFDFEKTDLGIEYVGGGNSGVNHAVSIDGINFTGRKQILGLGVKGNWDDKILYRPCLLKVNKKYHLFYTGQSEHNKHIGLTIAEKDDDITSLRGISAGSMWQWVKPLF